MSVIRNTWSGAKNSTMTTMDGTLYTGGANQNLGSAGGNEPGGGGSGGNPFSIGGAGAKGRAWTKFKQI